MDMAYKKSCKAIGHYKSFIMLFSLEEGILGGRGNPLQTFSRNALGSSPQEKLELLGWEGRLLETLPHV